ncbi:MAG: leucyl aminopeptidase [Candidatus Sumerlaeia bacterium]|nr:leucyl aminopeptidase [Candidatus Sumerlaeia bacterium]
MRYRVTTKAPADVQAEALVVLFDEQGPLGEAVNKVVVEHIASYRRALEKKTSSREWFCTLDPQTGAAARHLLLDSAAFGPWMPGREKLKCAAARAVSLCREHSISKIAFVVNRKDSLEEAQAVFEGAVLGDFADKRFKSEKPSPAPLDLTFVVAKDAQKATTDMLDATEPVLRGVNLARELVNAPNNILTPGELTGHGVEIAKEHGLRFELLDSKKLEKQGYNLLWNVGRGSEHEPYMLTVSYEPKGRVKLKEHLCLVGKGMTFDTGGYCIKDRANMYLMNNDMGGAAATLGTLLAVAELQLPLKMTAIIPSAHNAIDGGAYHPGAIITSKQGKTVFIGNTDAEGRLILADAFQRAARVSPDIMVDFATLTGACVMALGNRLAGLFTEDAQLRALFEQAGEATGDSLWAMPIWREYAHRLVHPLADLNNITKPGDMGGAIHAANFLKEFVPEGVRWAHVDIAGVAATDTPYRCMAAGGTGFGVRLMVDVIRRMVDAA